MSVEVLTCTIHPEDPSPWDADVTGMVVVGRARVDVGPHHYAAIVVELPFTSAPVTSLGMGACEACGIVAEVFPRPNPGGMSTGVVCHGCYPAAARFAVYFDRDSVLRARRMT